MITELHKRKLEDLLSSYVGAKVLKQMPKEGDVVFVGCTYSKSTWTLAVVEKIDGKGIIHTSVGKRFSSKKDFFSTQKVNDSWWQMLDLNRTYTEYLKRREEQIAHDLGNKRRDLVQRLRWAICPVSDQEFVSSMATMLSEYLASKQLENPEPICTVKIADIVPISEALVSCEIRFETKVVIEDHTYTVLTDAEDAAVSKELCERIVNRFGTKG